MNSKQKVFIIAGARPNFIKIAPLIREITRRKRIDYLLIHTGQHYDTAMSNIFFSELNIPQPQINLNVGSKSNTAQRAAIMEKLEPVFLREKPDLVIVVGDVNSTLAAALVAGECDIPAGHVEAGLRSFDMSMPEEVNRIITDRLSSFLFVTEKSGMKNLNIEGIDKAKVFFVGNVMIDNLISQMPLIDAAPLDAPGFPYMVVTLHRPVNVDDKKKLQSIMTTLTEISREIALIFPVHPRTLKNLRAYGIKAGRKIDMSELRLVDNSGIYLLPPLGYNEFLKLVKKSKGVITDSGGIQEESTYLKIPCLTLRERTERPVTIEIGTNILIGSNLSLLQTNVNDILENKFKAGRIPELWDGNAAARILTILEEKL